eukprot:Platyproteum_vivax@DN1059_c0_g1_i1.p1
MSTVDCLDTIRSVVTVSNDYALEYFDPSEETLDFMRSECKMLVIGAGGLGCEILKGLALSGFCNIHVIDMDNIDITNLNRQFLFRAKDVGRPKATVAAEFINSRCGHMGVTVTPHLGKIQDKDTDFYDSFNVIIAGLDNIAARRWINSLLHDMVGKDADGNIDPSTIKPLLDGGTEGFKGQARVILAGMTSCFECSLETFPPQVNYPLCTIAETPRLPEHCVEYAYTIMWEKEFGNKAVNGDSVKDITWIYEKALERSETYGIAGVTYQLTLGVVKRIIPAIASTNALIAAALVTEAIKIMSYCAPPLSNYFMYMGMIGMYTYTFDYAKKEDCQVCSSSVLSWKVPPSITLEELIVKLQTDVNLQLTRPSISSGEGVVFMQKPEVLRRQHEYKLSQTLGQLVQDKVFQIGEELIVTDPVIPSKLKLKLLFEKQ